MKNLTALVLAVLVLPCVVSFPAGALAQEAERPDPPTGEEQLLEAADPAEAAEAAPVMTEPEAEPIQEVERSEVRSTETRRYRRVNRQPMIRFGQDAELRKGESAEMVVVIGGDAKISGKVSDAVVAVGGSITMAEGSVARSAVAVLGNVAVENGAEVRNEAVSVGGRVNVAEGGSVSGEALDIDLGGLLPSVEWLQDWVRHCVFMMRPLSFKVGWVWAVAGMVFLFYALVALIFQKPVRQCVEEINRRPASTFLMGVLVKLLVPIVVILLAATGIGLIIIPFLVAALLLGAIIGKVAIIQWLGLSVARPFGTANNAFNNPFVALVLGSLVLCLIYVVPIVGLIAWMVFSVWGLGVGVLAAAGGFRRELPPRSPTTGYTPPPSPMTPYTSAPPPGAYSEGQVLACAMPGAETFGVPPAAENPAGTAAGAPPPPGETAGIGAVPPNFGAQGVHVGAPPLIPEALAFPRAGFWERMAAGFLDIVLVSILGHVVGGPPWAFVVAAAYFSAMWAWRATTIGGIVLGLKVVRQDGQPISYAVALVRALGAGFSIIVGFLGFFNITWDKEKQAWHDRIAGTVVIKLPKGTPLLML